MLFARVLLDNGTGARRIGSMMSRTPSGAASCMIRCMRSPLTSRRLRITGTIFAIWIALAAVQTGVNVIAGSGQTPWWMVAFLQLLHATAWTAIALGVRLVTGVRGGVPKRMMAHAGALLIAAVIDAIVRRAITEAFVGDVRVSFARTMLYYADVTTLSYILSVWLGKVVDAREALITQAGREIALRTQLARARLGWLQAQLQPHFLFNALGTVSELIFENPAAAVKTFAQLRAVLRSAAARSSDLITLDEELAALEPYLEVQRTRFSDWLTIRLDVGAGAGKVRIPPLTLQPLVENSIRHGLRGRSQSGEITITAGVEDTRLIVSVRDNGIGLKEGGDRGRSGVGLSNTEERLRTIYGDAASLRVFNDDLGGAVAEIVMPARRDAAPAFEQTAESRDSALETSAGFARRNPVPALICGGLLAAALWSQQSYAYLVMTGRVGNRTIFDIAAQDFILVALWTAMLPLVVFLSRRLPLTRSRWLTNGLLHVASLCLLAAAHASIVSIVRGDLPAGLVSGIVGSAPITLLLYFGAAAYAHRRTLEEWFAERQLASARYEAEIAEANVTAAAMQVSQDSLDTVMLELERYASGEPLRAERAVASLGSGLRAALEAGSRERSRLMSPGSGPLGGEDREERLAVSA
jgi:hypothetical protein